MIIRRAYKQGSSTVIALPPVLLSYLNLSVGDYFKVEASKYGIIHLVPVKWDGKRYKPWPPSERGGTPAVPC